jgi:hypothetical protein
MVGDPAHHPAGRRRSLKGADDAVVIDRMTGFCGVPATGC